MDSLLDLPAPNSVPIFLRFQSLPTELRLRIWRYALPGLRIVHLRQKRLKELEGRWWERVRSDITMEPCNRPKEHRDDNGDANLEVDFEEAGDYGDDLGAGSRGDSDSDANSQHELIFDNGVDKPKGFMGIQYRKPNSSSTAFSSVGGIPQVYFDPLQDTLFIDHETFFERYEWLPAFIEWYLLPCDRAIVRQLAIEGLVPYEHSPPHRDLLALEYRNEWLVEISSLFPNVDKVSEICDHYVYGPQIQTSQKYLDLKILDYHQNGIDIDERPKTLENHPPRGTFYMEGIRIDRSLFNWDRLLDRHMTCLCSEGELYEIWEELQDDSQKKNPNFEPSKIVFDFADLISTVDKKALLHDAVLFEIEKIKAQWLSYSREV